MFSGAVKLLDLNDFIAPAQDCVVIKKDTNSSGSINDTKNLPSDSKSFSDSLKNKISKDENSKSVKVSLHDCLACSGCVTSAETVLLQQQSEEEFLSKLQQHDIIVAVTISPQSRAALAEYYGLPPSVLASRLTRCLRSLGAKRVYDLSTARDLALMETADDFIRRLKAQRINDAFNATVASTIATSASTVIGCLNPISTSESLSGPLSGTGSGAATAVKRIAPRVFGRGRAKTLRPGTSSSPVDGIDPEAARVEDLEPLERSSSPASLAKSPTNLLTSVPLTGSVSSASNSASNSAGSVGRVVGTSGSKTEFVGSSATRAEESRPLPVLASSCPGWVVYAEKSQNSKQLLPYLCTSRSPQAVQGALLKRLVAPALSVAPQSIYHVTVMPCYDKKLEAARDDLSSPAEINDSLLPMRLTRRDDSSSSSFSSPPSSSSNRPSKGDGVAPIDVAPMDAAPRSGCCRGGSGEEATANDLNSGNDVSSSCCNSGINNTVAPPTDFLSRAPDAPPSSSIALDASSAPLSDQLHRNDAVAMVPDTDCCLTTGELLSILLRFGVDLSREDGIHPSDAPADFSRRPAIDQIEGKENEKNGLYDLIIDDIIGSKSITSLRQRESGGGFETPNLLVGVESSQVAAECGGISSCACRETVGKAAEEKLPPQSQTQYRAATAATRNVVALPSSSAEAREAEEDSSRNASCASTSAVCCRTPQMASAASTRDGCAPAVQLYGMPGGSGGYAEYVFRRAAREVFGREVTRVEFRALRNTDFQEAVLAAEPSSVEGTALPGPDAVKTTTTTTLSSSSSSPQPLPQLKVARVYGFRNIQTVLRQIRSNKCGYHFIEIMACPGGCLNGGGQIKPQDFEAVATHATSAASADATSAASADAASAASADASADASAAVSAVLVADASSVSASSALKGKKEEKEKEEEEALAVAAGVSSQGSVARGNASSAEFHSRVAANNQGTLAQGTASHPLGSSSSTIPSSKTSTLTEVNGNKIVVKKVISPQELLERLEAKYHHQDVAFRLPEDNPEARFLYHGLASDAATGLQGNKMAHEMLRARFVPREKTNMTSATSLAQMW